MAVSFLAYGSATQQAAAFICARFKSESTVQSLSSVRSVLALPKGPLEDAFRQSSRRTQDLGTLLSLARNTDYDPKVSLRSASARLSSSSQAATATATPSAEVLDAWRLADCVCFDVDSTVCVDEGIDELAAFCGAGEAVAAWTTRAMTGDVPFQDALAARLDLIQPTAAKLKAYLDSHPPRLNPGIEELVSALMASGKAVYLVSGGFRQMIEPAAVLLGIPVTNIYANRLLFDADGGFAGFDPEEPTSRSGGKAVVIQMIKKEHGYSNLVMVGDGATDLEARSPGGADLFIGYGGIQVRPKVAASADWFVFDFKEMTSALASSGSN
eukprot:TRINITY_DN1724_c1_g1_i1.p1 TRINITY_DN1724_c1_g1~~TRINITY_DN1724_c1_g1_i1.p1  ORF type:complete len:327 (-),score=54.15 TRINITY_DN1724_c1_g1_i1:652-1632(-)